MLFCLKHHISAQMYQKGVSEVVVQNQKVGFVSLKACILQPCSVWHALQLDTSKRCTLEGCSSAMLLHDAHASSIWTQQSTKKEYLTRQIQCKWHHQSSWKGAKTRFPTRDGAHCDFLLDLPLQSAYFEHGMYSWKKVRRNKYLLLLQ